MPYCSRQTGTAHKFVPTRVARHCCPTTGRERIEFHRIANHTLWLRTNAIGNGDHRRLVLSPAWRSDHIRPAPRYPQEDAGRSVGGWHHATWAPRCTAEGLKAAFQDGAPMASASDRLDQSGPGLRARGATRDRDDSHHVVKRFVPRWGAHWEHSKAHDLSDAGAADSRRATPPNRAATRAHVPPKEWQAEPLPIGRGNRRFRQSPNCDLIRRYRAKSRALLLLIRPP